MAIKKTALTSSIRNVYEQITPDEIKSVEVFSTSIDVFCDLLEDYSQASIDIKNILTDDYFLEEYFKTYNGVLWDTIKDLKTDQSFFRQNEIFKELSGGQNILDLDLINNPIKHLDKQELSVFREVLQTSGLKEGIRFVYEWIGRFSAEEIKKIKITEIQPFVLDIEGTLNQAVFNHFVRILQIPLGFQYTYAEVTDIEFKTPDYYYNKDNVFQLTPDVIDGNGFDDFWQNNTNPFLGPLSAQDFPDYTQLYQEHSVQFTNLIVSTRDFNAFVWTNYDFLQELDENLEPTGNTVTVEKFSKNGFLLYNEEIYEFSNSRYIVLKREFLHEKNYLSYYDENSNLILELGHNEYVDILPYNAVFNVTEGSISVLDKFDIVENTDLTDLVQIYVKDLPPLLQDVDFVQPLATYQNIQFDNTQYIIFSDLNKEHKPLVFDFVDSSISVSPDTPYSNDVYSPELRRTLQEDSVFDTDDWNSQYFDWNLPERNPENYDEVFQNSDQNQKWFFSQLDYEPWQEFDNIVTKSNYGYWTNPLHEWKFIGQDSGRPVLIGDGHIVNRGVRKVTSIPGFKKVPPLVGSSNYQKSEHNLELTRGYWQAQDGIIIYNVGEVINNVGNTNGEGVLYVGYNYDQTIGDDSQQYTKFKEAMSDGVLDNQYGGDNQYLNIINNNTGLSLSINTINNKIGSYDTTSITIDGNALVIGYEPNYLNFDTYLQIDGGELVGQDVQVDGAYWFELPKKRIQTTDTEHTFYRQISPRQEEFNYMYFNAKRDLDCDPVNLQYRTLECFDIQSIE